MPKSKQSNVEQLEALPSIALDYVRRGWALVKLNPGTKQPAAGEKGWQRPERWLVTEQQVLEAFSEQQLAFGAKYHYGVGLIHGGSNTLALDIDDLALARQFFTAAGIDLDGLLATTARIVRDPSPEELSSGKRRAKALFTVPPGVALGYGAVSVKQGDASVAVFELRAGKGRFDVLPPSVHPSGAKLRWAGYADPGVVEVPQSLVDLYPRLKALAKQLGPEWSGSAAKVKQVVDEPEDQQQQWQLSPFDQLVFDLIGGYDELLLGSGLYEQQGERFRPAGSRSNAGITVFESGKLISSHASDVLHVRRGTDPSVPFSPFEVYALLYHFTEGASKRSWIQAAADELNRLRRERQQARAAEDGESHDGGAPDDPPPATAEAKPAPEAHALALPQPLQLLPEDEWPEPLRLRRLGKTDVVDVTELNLNILLRYHHELAGCFRYDAFTQQVYLVDAPFETKHFIKPFDEKSDVNNLLTWMQTRDEWKLFTRVKGLVVDAVHSVARRYEVDTLVNHVQLLPPWDQQPRLDTWLSVYCGADDTPLNRELGRRYLIGMVRRAMEPGCDMKRMIIFEGEQDIGKSSLGKILAGQLDLGPGAKLQLCSAKHIDLSKQDDDKGSELLQRIWLQEMAELSTFRASERELLKGFLSRTDDYYRTKYDVHATNKPRRCVFFGTTNEFTYLDDPTGNVRFWPVRLRQVQFEAVERDRDQLLAEALAAWRQGETHELAPEHKAELGQRTEQRQHAPSKYDSLMRQLPAAVRAMISKAPDHPLYVPSTEAPPPTGLYVLNSDLLSLAGLDDTKSNQTTLGIYMQNTLGWQKVQVKFPGVKTYPRGWSPSLEWLKANGIDARGAEPAAAEPSTPKKAKF